MGGGESKRCVWWWMQLLVAATYHLQTCVRGEPQVTCFFIFGDSLPDPGNNNLRLTTAKANYFPYGIDFPGGVANGRFCNKFNSVDYLAKFMEIPLIPPFANTSGSDILKGVNYASAAGGILPDTGIQMGVHDNLGSQIIKHKVIYDAIAVKLRSVEAAEQYLHKCLYHINIGRNDYFDNYLKPLFNLTRFTDALIAQYALQIQALYELGARKFTLIGMGRIGCVPFKRKTDGKCMQVLNEAGSLFSEKLRSLVDQFNSNYSGKASFVFVNSTAISTQNPAFLALKNRNESCCKTVSSSVLCASYERPCENRDEHVHWDGLHTTDAAHKIYALSQYNASNPNFAYPMDINHLLSLPLSQSPSPSPAT